MFDLQLFGDNDTVTSASTLNIEWAFSDGDTRVVKLSNPRDDLVETDITAVSAFTVTNSVILGDKTGASSTGINSAIKVEQTKTKLDLS